MARFLIEVFVAWAPPSIPRANEAGLNPYVFAFAISAAVGAVFMSAAAPVWLTSRGDVESLLRESTGRLTGGRWSVIVQGALTAAQAAIALPRWVMPSHWERAPSAEAGSGICARRRHYESHATRPGRRNRRFFHPPA